MNKKYATLWGKETDGTLIAPVINLWKTTQGVYVADNLSGAVRHGEKVEVLERRGDWVKVYKMILHDGKEYPQKGWVKNSLIRF